MYQKNKRIESKNLRDSARGQQCQVRLAVCNFNPETTVLAHVGGAGMALKSDDYQAAFACSSCHDEIDRRTRHFETDYVKLAHLEGVMRTQRIWFDMGLMAIK